MFNKTIFYTGIVSIFVLAGCGGSDNKKAPVASSSSSSVQSSQVQSSLVSSVSSSSAVVSSTSSSVAAVSSASSSSTAISSSSSSLAVTTSSSSISSATSSSSLSSSSMMSSTSSALSSSSSSLGVVTLNGVAAVGAPITNANVIAKCANNAGFTQTVTTNSQGVFSGTIAANALPCALQVSYGTPSKSLHSYAYTAGLVNITPLTDLIIANASTLDPSIWFAGNNWQLAENILTLAKANFKTSLSNAGYTLPQGNFEPFNIAFAIGDTWDQFLDQNQAAINASSTIGSYADLLALVKDGNLNALPPKVTGGSGTGNASACFNDTQYAQGTKLVTTFKTTSGTSQAVLDFTSNTDINGTTTFNGKSATESFSQTQATGSAPSTSATKSYFKTDTAAKRSTYYGSIVESSAPVVSNSTVKIIPERIERFDLAANESYSQTYSIETSSVVFGFPITVTTQHATTITFKGIESVSVPAGTFEACRFETSDAVTSSGLTTNSTATNWISTQKGVLLRTEAGNDVTVLMSASINGAAVN